METLWRWAENVAKLELVEEVVDTVLDGVFAHIDASDAVREANMRLDTIRNFAASVLVEVEKRCVYLESAADVVESIEHIRLPLPLPPPVPTDSLLPFSGDAEDTFEAALPPVTPSVVQTPRAARTFRTARSVRTSLRTQGADEPVKPRKEVDVLAESFGLAAPLAGRVARPLWTRPDSAGAAKRLTKVLVVKKKPFERSPVEKGAGAAAEERAVVTQAQAQRPAAQKRFLLASVIRDEEPAPEESPRRRALTAKRKKKKPKAHAPLGFGLPSPTVESSKMKREPLPVQAARGVTLTIGKKVQRGPSIRRITRTLQRGPTRTPGDEPAAAESQPSEEEKSESFFPPTPSVPVPEKAPLAPPPPGMSRRSPQRTGKTRMIHQPAQRTSPLRSRRSIFAASRAPGGAVERHYEGDLFAEADDLL